MTDQVDPIGHRSTSTDDERAAGSGIPREVPSHIQPSRASESSVAAMASGSAPPDFSETFESRPIGEYLRSQRILRGVSIEELAAATRIPLRSLERLENGRFDGEIDGFVRGFVRTVANALGLDAEDAVSRMLREPELGSWERHSPSRRVKQASVGIALVLFLGVAFFVLRAGWNLLLGTASTPASREVVLWRDPVRALAESRGFVLDGQGPQVLGGAIVRDIASGSGFRSDEETETDRSKFPSASQPLESE